MKIFHVTVTETVTSSSVVLISANSAKDAKEQVLLKKHEGPFSVLNIEYDCEAQEVKKIKLPVKDESRKFYEF
jgi:hypothetical protein